MKKTSQSVTVVAAVVVLIAALGLGLGIRKIRSWRAETQPETRTQIQSTSAAKQLDARWDDSTIEPNDHADLLAQEPTEQDLAEPEQSAQDASTSESTTESTQAPMPGAMGDWRSFLADLNLTEEEMARLREGFQLAMERWRNMSEDERQTEIARMRAMRGRWETMSDEERQAAMDRGRQRFEEWRRSDRVELPEITLD